MRRLVISKRTFHPVLLCVCAVVCASTWISRLPSGTQSQLTCAVSVINPLDAVNISNGFSYKSELTPVITEVSPRRGGTAGGTRLTITGSGFRYSEGGFLP